MMEKRSMVLLTVIALATLLVAVVGATFAYFSATSATDERGEDANGATQFTTATVADSTTLNTISGAAGSFTDTDIYPGHQEVAGLKVDVTGEAGKYTVPFLYNVTDNTISENGGTVNYYLYRADSDTPVDMGCIVNAEDGAGEVKYSEKCTFQHAATVGQTSTSSTGLTLIAKGSLSKTGGAQSVQMNDDIEIEASSASKYYYFVLEYKNEESKQNDEENNQSGKTVKGTITVAGAKANS